jgi:hypothetical protein
MATSQEAHALNQRITALAKAEGVPPQRIRNRLGFQRILARLSQSPDWVLKGGFSLEVRLGLRARATKDLDVLHLGEPLTDADILEDILSEALERDLADGFTFRARPPKQIRAQDAEPSSWRVGIDVLYFGSQFGSITIDVVSSAATISVDTEPLTIEPILIGDAFEMPALDLERHAAEKYHAYARIYAHDRPSSRVKDLVDLVVMDENHNLDDADLGDAIIRVFRERDQADPPEMLPEPPHDWERTFPAMAEEIGASITDVREAWQVANAMYQRALKQEDEK